MSQNKKARRQPVAGLDLSAEAAPVMVEKRSLVLWLRSHLIAVGTVAFLLLLGLGAMAKNGWLPSTDPLSGQKTGWFGRKLPKNAGSTWNPLAAPMPTPTPQLSKEYIYAGSRLLAVADANAQEVPPTDLAVWRLTKGHGTWMVMDEASTTYDWGELDDIPEPGDYDGDGKTDFCVFRPSDDTWHKVLSSDESDQTIPFGISGDIPTPADFDGDGKTDIAVFRPSNGNWYIYQSSTSTIYNCNKSSRYKRRQSCPRRL